MNTRQKRMLLYLSQFKLNVRYIKGINNKAADALSRIFEDMSEDERSIYLPDQSSKDDFVVAIDQQSEIKDADNTTENSETNETKTIAEFIWTERNPSNSEPNRNKLVIDDDRRLLLPTVDQKIGEIASFVTSRSLIPEHRAAVSKIYPGVSGVDDDGRQRNKSLSLNDPWVTSSTEENGDTSPVSYTHLTLPTIYSV